MSFGTTRSEIWYSVDIVEKCFCNLIIVFSWRIGRSANQLPAVQHYVYIYSDRFIYLGLWSRVTFPYSLVIQSVFTRCYRGMLVFQTNPVWVELFSLGIGFLLVPLFLHYMLATWVKMLYIKIIIINSHGINNSVDTFWCIIVNKLVLCSWCHLILNVNVISYSCSKKI